jgi:hypothetical protein
MEQNTKLEIYYEGGTVDRFWLAPAGLSLDEARRRREGRLYRTREGVMRALANHARKET